MSRRAARWSRGVGVLVAGATLSCGGAEAPSMAIVTIAPAEVTAFASDAALQQIQDVAVGPSGNIWVLQRVDEPHLFLYSDVGELTDAFRARGGAEQELSNPIALLPTENASRPMQVWDAGKRRVVTYSNAGRIVAAVQIDRSNGRVYRGIEDHSYGEPLKMTRFGDGYLLEDHPDGLSVTGDYLRSDLLRLAPDGQIASHLLNFAREFASGIAALGDVANLLVPVPLWTTCPSGELVLFDPFRSALRWIGIDGSVQREDSVAIERPEITEDDQRTYLNREFDLRWREQREGEPDSAVIERSVDNFMLRSWNRFPERGPAAVGMLCGPAQEVWLQQFSTASDPRGYSEDWVVLRAGLPPVRVDFPAGFRPHRIAGERILGQSAAVGRPPVPASVPVPSWPAGATP